MTDILGRGMAPSRANTIYAMLPVRTLCLCRMIWIATWAVHRRCLSWVRFYFVWWEWEWEWEWERAKVSQLGNKYREMVICIVGQMKSEWMNECLNDRMTVPWWTENLSSDLQILLEYLFCDVHAAILGLMFGMWHWSEWSILTRYSPGTREISVGQTPECRQQLYTIENLTMSFSFPFPFPFPSIVEVTATRVICIDINQSINPFSSCVTCVCLSTCSYLSYIYPPTLPSALCPLPSAYLSNHPPLTRTKRRYNFRTIADLLTRQAAGWGRYC